MGPSGLSMAAAGTKHRVGSGRPPSVSFAAAEYPTHQEEELPSVPACHSVTTSAVLFAA
jgi:hypothetical protein